MCRERRVGPSSRSTFCGRCQATFVGFTWNCRKRRYDLPSGMWPSVKTSRPFVARLGRSATGSTVFIAQALGPARIEERACALRRSRLAVMWKRASMKSPPRIAVGGVERQRSPAARRPATVARPLAEDVRASPRSEIAAIGAMTPRRNQIPARADALEVAVPLEDERVGDVGHRSRFPRKERGGNG